MNECYSSKDEWLCENNMKITKGSNVNEALVEFLKTDVIIHKAYTQSLINLSAPTSLSSVRQTSSVI